jgi:hypothetical protein
MKDIILHLLGGRLKAAIQERSKLPKGHTNNLPMQIIDNWIGAGRGNSEDRKFLRLYLDQNFPR